MKISSGQIKFLIDYFRDYSDEKVKVIFLSSTNIYAYFKVATSLTVEEAQGHVEDLFKHSYYGPGLAYIIQVAS